MSTVFRPVPVPAGLPAFASMGALLLAMDAHDMEPPLAERVRIDGRWLRRKHEFHLTVLGSEAGLRVRALLGEEALQAALAELDWSVERSGRYELLGKLKPTATGTTACYSVIEHVRAPGMVDLYAVLAARIPDLPPCPPPHVTHYILGDPDGIGVPSRAALEAYRIRPVRAGELAGIR